MMFHRDAAQEGLLAPARFYAWSTFEFLASDGSINEVDLLVASPWGIFLVEIKGRPGCLSSDQAVWSWTSSEGRRYTADNPLLLTNRKAKRLKSSLASQPTLRRFNPPFIQPLVFCSAESLDIRLAEDARNLVAFRDDFFTGKPGIRGALFRRECPGLQKASKRLVDGTRPANYISRVDKRCDILGGCVTRSLSNTTRVLPGRECLPNRALYCTRAVRWRTHAIGVNSAADFTPVSPGRVSW